MSSAERNRFGASCVASVSLHVVALGAALHIAAPQMLWETNVARGRSAMFIVSIASEDSTASPTVELEPEPIEREPMEDAHEIKPNVAPLKPARNSADALHEIKIGEPLIETLKLTAMPLMARTLVEDELPVTATPAARPREKRKTPVSVAVAGSQHAAPAPAPIVAPLGADFDVPPKKLPENKPPEFPQAASSDRHEGRVTLVVRVEASGEVTQVIVENSSGHSSLDEAAITAVRDWRFTPATREGVAVPAEILVPIRFTLSRS